MIAVVSPWLFNLYVDKAMKEVKVGMGRMGFGFSKKKRGWGLPELLYEDGVTKNSRTRKL